MQNASNTTAQRRNSITQTHTTLTHFRYYEAHTTSVQPATSPGIQLALLPTHSKRVIDDVLCPGEKPQHEIYLPQENGGAWNIRGIAHIPVTYDRGTLGGGRDEPRCGYHRRCAARPGS